MISRDPCPLQPVVQPPYDDRIMKKTSSSLRTIFIFAALGATCASSNLALLAQAGTSATQHHELGVLDRAQAAAVLPTSVFYKGQSAPTQSRNSAGIRFPGDKLALAALVDTSGYSSAVQQTYQAYLLNEVQLKVGDKTLAPGAYGFGFVAGDRVVVMDIAGNEVLSATTTRDEQLARPNPLQIVAEPSAPGHFRLYLGRSYVVLSEAR
jgi:hypothetical protein